MGSNNNRPLKILTWHIHSSYLYYLLQTPHEFYVPKKPGRPEAYGGLPKGPSFEWPSNAHEVPAHEVKNLDLDVILFQVKRNYIYDQFEILSEEQRMLPRIYLEHDPPREHPTDTKHWVEDPNTLIVHVTHFNKLMWDNNRSPTKVIEHGVVVPEDIRYSGELNRGIVVVNDIAARGRRLGADIYLHTKMHTPLDLVGIKAEDAGGLGEIKHHELPAFEARYRYFFNPIRYTSLGLAVCEAMMVGLPIIGLATTEMVSVIENGYSGYLDTSIDTLIDAMKLLVAEPDEARKLSKGSRQTALERFNVQRFSSEWYETIQETAANGKSQQDLPEYAVVDLLEETFTSYSIPLTGKSTITTSELPESEASTGESN
ncbi:MAG: glycosyltransferase family 1 protein [Chloroflexi bacterium]|nr:MAG: glycosyltransferase family 1 protein [Chloroflexota bacterium]